MSPERWQQVKDVFQAALDLPPEQRSSYIQESCADPAVRREVESLLAFGDDSESFLEEAADQFVPELLEDDPPDANLGRRIGPYQIVREIGAGGMGAVYLAERVDEFHQQVALKLMRPGLNSRMVVSRFRHERQILAGLDHANIARLLDGGATEDGRPYFVMEYVEGLPIDVWCSQRELAIIGRLELFRKVCAAVEYAHRNLVVHRDLKPGNILVTADGTPKLLDFGIAKLLGAEAQAETALTQVGMRMMTPEYASPEQARGLPVNTATDVYSLGVVLYQLLAGRMPYAFATRSATEMERVICETEPAPPSAAAEPARGKSLAGDLDIIILKALEKESQRRYDSVEQFSEDIRRHLGGEPILARPHTLGYRTSRFVRRNRTVVGAAALIFLSLTAGLATTIWEAHAARQQRARAERRFADVRHLAESFLFEFDGKIQNLAGATPARHLVVERALEYLRSLVPEARGDSGLERELAEAYLKVGDVQGNPYLSNLGDTAGALASYQQALEIAEDAVRRDPRDVAARQYLARAHRSMGEVLPLRGDAAGAVTHFRAAVSLLEAAPPGDVNTEFELSSSYETLGDVLGHGGVVNLGDSQSARAAYEKALAVDQAILAAQPASAHAQRGVAVLRIKIGDLQTDAGEAAAALRNYQAAAEAAGKLSAADPLNASARRLMGTINRKLGEALEVSGQTGPALERYRRCAEVSRQAQLADPNNAQARMDYAGCLKDEGDLLAKSGDGAGALVIYRQVLDQIRPLAAAEPDNPWVQGRYAEMLSRTGDLMAETPQKEEARRLYGQGLAVLRRLADRPGATPDDVYQYAEFLLECPLEDLADPAAAVAYARRASDMTHDRVPQNLEQVARASFRTGDVAAAVAFEEKALALLPPSAQRKLAEERLERFQAARK